MAVCKSEPTSARQPCHAPPRHHELDPRSIKAGFGPPAMAGLDTFRRDLHPDPALRDPDYVLANGPASAGYSNQSGEGEIRQKLIEADLVDTALRESAFPQSKATPQVVSKAKNNMVALPGQLFYSTQISVCLWFLTRSKATDGKRRFRDRRGEALFIDARKMGTVAKSLGASRKVFDNCKNQQSNLQDRQ